VDPTIKSIAISNEKTDEDAILKATEESVEKTVELVEAKLAKTEIKQCSFWKKFC
jgi:hypothetical protein